MNEAEIDVQCPYCWERFGILVDPEGGAEQSYVQDCEVCCHPILLRVRAQPGRDPRLISAERAQ